MKLYILRNQEGKFFRAKGYGGYGETWQTNIDRARIYTKIGAARSQVSYFFNNWPQFGAPDLLEFTLNMDDAKVLDEGNRVLKQKKSKEQMTKKRRIREAEYQKNTYKSKYQRLRIN